MKFRSKINIKINKLNNYFFKVMNTLVDICTLLANLNKMMLLGGCRSCGWRHTGASCSYAAQLLLFLPPLKLLHELIIDISFMALMETSLANFYYSVVLSSLTIDVCICQGLNHLYFILEKRLQHIWSSTQFF